LVALVLSLGVANAFAETGTPSITINPVENKEANESAAIDYVAYRILEADIDKDPTVGSDGSTTANGTVAYYVTTADRAAQLSATDLFNVTKVEGQNKWFVELKNSATTAEQLVAAFSAESFDLSKFEKVEFSKAADATNATSGDVDPGYYYITSTLGSKIALQTLSPVTINEKNTYTTDDKTIPEVDKLSEIGQDITYTLTVNVPATANKEIVLTDTMSKGLKFKEIVSQTVKGANDTEAAAITGTVSAVTAAENDATKFTITYSADQVIAAAGKTITVLVKVEVTEAAAIDTDIPNTLDLKYGNVYEAKPVTVNTKPSKFTFDKVDGTDTTIKLTGAEFELHRAVKGEGDKVTAGDVISLVEVTAGEEYRIATPEEIAAKTNIVTTMTTTGKVITVNGIDKDLTYILVETKAPTGYNLPQNPNTEVKAGQDVQADINIEIQNNKGTQLPSTGGIGTTIFYVVGGVLVLAAIILLVTKKRMSE
jgi:fimbrial isopeptide formation D2 family protein/LPXTG-motif cell wall-anchored protein